MAREAYDRLVNANHEVTWMKNAVSTDELSGIIGDYHAYIIAGDERVTADIVDRACQLKIIVVLAIVVEDWVDIEAANAKNIRVLGTPTLSAQAVGELTIGLMLAAKRKIVALHNLARRG